jgi:hypothetical protein
MKKYKDLQAMLIDMNREIRDLKTAHKISSPVKNFFASIEPSSTQPITITYGSGQNDIITDVYTDADAVLGTISGNTQTIYFTSQAPLAVTVVSTRPILSIMQ